MKIIVYTAIFGGRDDLYPPVYLPNGVHFASFIGKGGVMDAKRFKILPHKYFHDYDVSVWMDGNFQLTGDIRKVISKFLIKPKHNFVVMRHPAENLGIKPSVYREAEVAVLQKRVPAKEIKRQMDYYRHCGLPKDTEVTMNGIIIRKHNEKEVKDFDEIWWSQLNRFTNRDQISFPYLAWQLGLKYGKLDNVEFTGDWFVFRPHAKRVKDG